MIANADLPPPHGLSREDSWPWLLSIYTCGRFTVLAQGKPLVFSGRAPNKPLELLRILIALGGRGVPSCSLAQVLWPHANLGAAKHALETTLYRLRKLLGDQTINVFDGHLTLNPSCCSLDVWSLECLLDPGAETMLPATRVQRLLDLYRGPFMEDNDAAPVLIQRERLHSKFLRAIASLGEELESQAAHEEAIDCYQRGIEIDPLAENLYRRLMLCYCNVGRVAEALVVYQRCRKILAHVLNAEPSAETIALDWEIKKTRSVQIGTVDNGKALQSIGGEKQSWFAR